MSQKKCPQCKNLISTTAPTCLYCGRPNKFVTKDYVNKKWNKDNSKKVRLQNVLVSKYLLFILIISVTILIIKFY